MSAYGMNDELLIAVQQLTDRVKELSDLMAQWIEEFTPEVERDDG